MTFPGANKSPSCWLVWPRWSADTARNALDRYCLEVAVALDHEGDEGESDPADPAGDLPATLGGEYHARSIEPGQPVAAGEGHPRGGGSWRVQPPPGNG